MRSFILSLGALLLSFAVTTVTEQLDPVDNMCFRFDHQSTIHNDTLYIDGGKATFIDINRAGDQAGNITVGYNRYIIAVDLKKSWDWKKDIKELALLKRTDPKTQLIPPVFSRGALYQGMADDENIYLWGGTTSYTNTSFPGFKPPTPSKYSLWAYNTASLEWAPFDVSKGSPNRPSSAAAAEAPDQGLAFFLNGQLDSGSSSETQNLGDQGKVFLQGMIVLDLKNRSAKNLSTSALSGQRPRSRGRMQYIPGIGQKGILVHVGGNQKIATDTTNSYVGDLLSMTDIDIFDIGSMYDKRTPDGVWYKQTASGDVPLGRLDSCLALGSAPDGSSHNIYLYGGRSVEDQHFDDIHILSLPSFKWTKAYEGNNTRFAHTCHRVGSRTMLTVGGTNSFNFQDGPCDTQRKGVHVFDMSSITWGSAYNASAGPYTVPELVVTNIGGSPNGNATAKTPLNGFTQPGLAALFDPSSVTPVKITQTPRPRNYTAVLVGGTIGGTIFFALLFATLYFYHKRLRHAFLRLSESRIELGDECKFEIDGSCTQEIDGICRLEIDGTSKYEMDANENAALKIMHVGVLCELPDGNTTPINRRDEKERREGLMRGGDGNERGKGSRNGSGNAKERKVDGNTAEPVAVEVKHRKRCDLNAINNTVKDSRKGDGGNDQRVGERRPGGLEGEGGWF